MNLFKILALTFAISGCAASPKYVTEGYFMGVYGELNRQIIETNQKLTETNRKLAETNESVKDLEVYVCRLYSTPAYIYNGQILYFATTPCSIVESPEGWRLIEGGKSFIAPRTKKDLLDYLRSHNFTTTECSRR